MTLQVTMGHCAAHAGSITTCRGRGVKLQLAFLEGDARVQERTQIMEYLCNESSENCTEGTSGLLCDIGFSLQLKLLKKVYFSTKVFFSLYGLDLGSLVVGA